MNKAIIISFDLIREGEPTKSYAVSHIISFAKEQYNYNKDYSLDHLTINMNSLIGKDTNSILKEIKNRFNPLDYNIIAISAYVWNEFLINPLVDRLRASGYKNLIVLGGYQISYANSLKELQASYPKVNSFLIGYAEESFYKLLCSKSPLEKYDSIKPNFSILSSPYLTNQIEIKQNQAMIRWETKRGCLYACNFCAHKAIGELGTKPEINVHLKKKLSQELKLFKDKKIKRINVLDPLFNIGSEYMNILEMITNEQLESEFTFQIRLENIKENDRERFIDYVKNIKCTLEFGIQTLVKSEWDKIGRHNSLNLIEKNLGLFNENNIQYEASLIYGLPNQTLQSFQESINKLSQLGCKKITAWPLMLLKGTDLYNRKNEYKLTEKILGDFNIPTVVSSDSFSYSEWQEMKNIADELEKNHRF